MTDATSSDGASSEKRYRIVRNPRYRLTGGEKFIAVMLALGVLILALVPFVFFLMLPGEVGVLYRVFAGGTQTNFVYPEGLGVKLPWDRIYHYSVRVQARDEDVHALAMDGLSVQMKITVLFHPIPNAAGRLHKEIGTEYAERVVRPVAIGAVRDIVGKYDPHEIYRRNVDDMEQEILAAVRSSPAALGLIEFTRVVIRELSLPPTLDEAITRKLTEEQYAQTYEYLIDQTRWEAERKRIEAIGIQTFYSIVANALTPQLLTWRGIEATVQLARSNNAKVVIVGSGKDQLPLILGSDVANQPALPAPTPVNPDSSQLPSLDDLPPLFPRDRLGSTGSGSDGTARSRARPDTGVRGGSRPQQSPSTAPASSGDNR
jgi:regulator of protease activity HflC (stomatin/prohibitin superfamily)